MSPKVCPSSEESVLVIAFDGLDKELIEEFELENIRQKEFGFINNYTGISRIKLLNFLLLS